MADFYRRIPRMVRALQFVLTDSFKAELEEFTGGKAQIHTDTQPVTIDIREGAAHWLALPGDWIVKLAPEVFRCYSPIDFAAEFEPFPAPPDPPLTYRTQRHTVFFFPNGNTAVCCGQDQVPELQQSWLRIFVRFLEEHGLNPLNCEFNMPSGMVARVSRRDDGDYQWSIEHSEVSR